MDKENVLYITEKLMLKVFIDIPQLAEANNSYLRYNELNLSDFFFNPSTCQTKCIICSFRK